MSRKKKVRKMAAARKQEKPLDAAERKVQKSRERRFAECMDLSQKLISHIPKEHPAHQQQLLDCSIWCNQTRPSVLDRSISIPEQGRTFNYTLIPEANIPNKVSLIHNDNLDDEEPDSVAEPIQDEGGGSSGGGSAEGSQ